MNHLKSGVPSRSGSEVKLENLPFPRLIIDIAPMRGAGVSAAGDKDIHALEIAAPLTLTACEIGLENRCIS